jgi:hypothetical protein
MTTITTQSTKTTALTLAEADANFSQVAQAKIGGYTCVEGDNRDTIECSGTFTVTLPVAATITAAADTGDYEVTIKNVGGGIITVALSGSDIFDSSTAQVDYLTRDMSKTYKVNNSDDGYNIIAQSGSYIETVNVLTGTSVELCDTVPFWAKRITLGIYALEFSSASESPAIELGNASTYLTSGYTSTCVTLRTLGTSASTGSSNILIGNSVYTSTTASHSGTVVLTRAELSNIWNYTSSFVQNGAVVLNQGNGIANVGTKLTRLRIRSGGFDGSGSVTVIIE